MVVGEMEELVVAFQGLSLAEMAQEEAPTEEWGAGGLEREAYQEACEFGLGDMGFPVGGAEAEVTSLRVAEHRTELAQA